MDASKNGKGVFANTDLKKGDIILFFSGVLFSYAQLPTPYNAVEDHYVQIGADLYLGPSGALDDYFNHSCDPNAGLKIRDKEVALIAIRDIAKGEEVVWDYSTTMDEDDWEIDCRCGSAHCRHKIRDFKYLPPDIRRKYACQGIVPAYNLKYVTL